MAGGGGRGRAGVYHRKAKKQQKESLQQQQQCSTEPSTSGGLMTALKADPASTLLSPFYLLWSALWLKAVWLLRLIRGDRTPRTTPQKEETLRKKDEKEVVVEHEAKMAKAQPDTVEKKRLDQPEPEEERNEYNSGEETVREEEDEDMEDGASTSPAVDVDEVDDVDVDEEDEDEGESYEGSSRQESDREEEEEEEEMAKGGVDEGLEEGEEDDDDLGCSVSCSGDDDDSASSSSDKNTSNDSAICVQSSPATPAPPQTAAASPASAQHAEHASSEEPQAASASSGAVPLMATTLEPPADLALAVRLDKLDLDDIASQGESEPTTPAPATPSQSDTTTLIEEEEDAEKAAAAKEEARRVRRAELEEQRERFEADKDQALIYLFVDEEACSYTREYLYVVRDLEMEFKLTPCPVAPDALLLMGVCRSQYVQEKRERKGGSDNQRFVPPWAGQQQKGKHAYMGRNSEQFNRMGPKKGGDRPKYPPSIRPSIERPAAPSVKLHKAANAWKADKVEKDDTSDEAARKLLLKNVRALMNKITPTNAEVLTKQFISYDVPNSSSLDDVIGIIFDKAVEEPKFCPLYSRLCSDQVNHELEKNSKVSKFRNSILARAQQTFSTKNFDDIVKQKEEEIEAETDPKKKLDLQIELLEAKSKFRRRKFGNITFIGQLYLNALLSIRIIHYCLSELLKKEDSDDESIDCAVRLLETVGETLERELNSAAKDQSKQPMPFTLDMVFQILHQAQEKVSSRIRFMILNLNEMRKSNWVKRTKDQGPKKLDEIKKDIQKEEMENNLARDQYERKAARQGYGGGGGGGGGGQGGNPRRQVTSRNSLDNRPPQQQQSKEDKFRNAAKASGLASSGSGPKKDLKLRNLDTPPLRGKKAWSTGATGGSDTSDKKKQDERLAAMSAAQRIGGGGGAQLIQRRSGSRASVKEEEETAAGSGPSTEANSEDEREREEKEKEAREKREKKVMQRINCDVEDYTTGEIPLEGTRESVMKLITEEGEPADFVGRCFLLAAIRKARPDVMPKYGHVLATCLRKVHNKEQNKHRDALLKGVADFCCEVVDQGLWDDYPMVWQHMAELLINSVMAEPSLFEGDRPCLVDFRHAFVAAAADDRKEHSYELYVRTLARMAELNYARDNSDHSTITSMSFEELEDVNKIFDKEKLETALRAAKLNFSENLYDLLHH